MTKKPRILICDDDLAVLQSFKMILKDRAYDLVFAATGPRALEIIKTQKVDLLLLDIMMPKMSGVEVAQHVARIKPKLKIIVITSLLHHGVAIELYKCGVIDFIAKPPEPKKVWEAIEKALQKG